MHIQTTRTPRSHARTHLLVLLNGHASEEDGHLDAVHVLGEALVLLADLEGQFARVAQHDHRHLEAENTCEVRRHKAQLLIVGGAWSSWLQHVKTSQYGQLKLASVHIKFVP